jgi:hypothetical protein
MIAHSNVDEGTVADRASDVKVNDTRSFANW